MKKNKLYYFFGILLITMALASCTERIDIDLDSERIRLVVEGNISNIHAQQFVKLTETANYFSNAFPSPVSNASVKITDAEQVYILQESEANLGTYLFPAGFIGQEGETYNLFISLQEEVGGYKDFSAQTIMPHKTDDIDSISVEWRTRFEGWVVRLYAKDPPIENYYMFNGIRDGQWITDTISEVNISDDRLFNGNNTNGAIVLFFNENQLSPGDEFTLVMSNITKGYAAFVSELQTEIQPKQPLFSGPPANVSSNISNGAAGWFTAFPSTFTTSIVKEKP